MPRTCNGAAHTAAADHANLELVRLMHAGHLLLLPLLLLLFALVRQDEDG